MTRQEQVKQIQLLDLLYVAALKSKHEKDWDLYHEVLKDFLHPTAEKGRMMESMVQSKMVIRVRIAHSHTLKDGWRLSETTIEATGTGIDYDYIQEELQRAYDVGLEESIRRNTLDRHFNRGVLAEGDPR